MTRTPVAQSALHHFQAVHGTQTEARGALMMGERAGAGVLDIVGAGLADLANGLGMQDVSTGEASPLTIGSTANARWYRLTRQQARVVANLDEIDAARATLSADDNSCLHVTNISSGLTTIVLAGPRSPDLLARLVRVDTAPHSFENMRLSLTGAAGIPLQVVRWDRGDLLAYELTVGRDVAEYFADSVLHAGEDLGLQFVGADALAQLES